VRVFHVPVMLLGVLCWSTASYAGQACEVVPMPCRFEAPAFHIRLRDAETKSPLVDVHALAEWQSYGAGGRLDGPVMVLDGTSGPEGVIRFRAWGPIEGPGLGLGVGRDPVITLLKAGYEILMIGNRYVGPGREREQVRRFSRDGETFALRPFTGTPEQRLGQLRKVWLGIAVSRTDEETLKFREPYLNRLRRVALERERIGSSRPRDVETFLRNLDRELELLDRRP